MYNVGECSMEERRRRVLSPIPLVAPAKTQMRPDLF